MNQPRVPSILRLFALGLIAIIGLSLSGSMMAQDAPTDAASDDPAAGLEMLALLNQWRLELGLAPLKPNETLHAMALDQAGYLRSLPPDALPSGNEMHIGADGGNVRDRAARYGWTAYGEGGFAAISEVAWVGPTANGIEFWKGSDIHRETITNPGFREVGVAAVLHPWGHVFIVVLGARPDVLPALADPGGGFLYLTQDTFKYGFGNVPPMQIHLFNADGRPLYNGQMLDWAPTLPIPADAGSKVYVLYHDGLSQSLAEVDLTRDQVVLPAAEQAASGG